MIIGMNKKLFKQLCMNYNKEADKELYELWEYNLRPYDEEELKKAFGIIMVQDKYFPNLNRVLEVVKDVVNRETFDDRYKLEKLDRIKPEWYGKEIKNEPIDEETKKEFEDFNKFIEEFRIC